MKIAVIGSVPESLTLFRGDLIKEIKQAGHEVFALAGHHSDTINAQLNESGITFIEYPLKRTRTNPLSDLGTCIFFFNFFKKYKIDLILSYTPKPVIWGGIAARLAGVENSYAMITGLGRQFRTDDLKSRVIGKIIGHLYRYSLRSTNAVIFQNTEDRQFFIDNGLVKDSKTHKVNGSGINTSDYPESDLPTPPIVFLTVGRFLTTKGFREFVAAAETIHQEYPEVIFTIVGYSESGGDSIPSSEILKWKSLPYINFVGRTHSALDELKKCHVYVLASYYREGVPRTILEALSIGRAVITTDNVGCRDAVDHGISGLVIPARDTEALTGAMLRLIENSTLISEMGKNARLVATDRYCVKKVNRALMEIMLLTSSP